MSAPPEQLAQIFNLTAEPIIASRYNIAPTQPVAIVRMNPQAKNREWALTLWGLVPSWAKDPSIGARLINARAETVCEKPSFRSAFKRRRCLVPASGFYEWQRQEKGKRPFFITSLNGLPFAIAGLWESWSGNDGVQLETCTLLTTDPNELMAPIHNRMPLILAPEDYAQWLGRGGDDSPQALDQLQHLFRPYPSTEMTAYPVSTYVNNARHEGVECIASLSSSHL